MNSIRLSDLDELALTVRDRTSQSYVLEAIEAYRGGAYRSAIVSIWIAVTYDIIAKLRELASQDDESLKNVKHTISELDDAIKKEDIKALQRIEDDLLNKALNEFEFISKHEFKDMKRLKEDRNLCAHPAFVSEDVLFNPEPERVRMHIVHAVKALMQHQPIQGKAVIDRLDNDIKSPFFPSDLDTVQIYLNSKYLDHAKESLIKKIIIVLVVKILHNEDTALTISYHKKIALALKAISNRHVTIYEEQMCSKLPTLTEKLEDSKIPNIYRLLGIDSRCWKWIRKPTQIWLKKGVTHLIAQPTSREVIFTATNVEELREEILTAFNSLDQKAQINIIASSPQPEFSDRAIEIYSRSNGFRTAEHYGKTVILPMIEYFSTSNILEIIEVVKQNSQIWDAGETPSILEMLYDGTKKLLPQTKNSWQSLFDFLSPEYGWKLERSEIWENTSWKGLAKRLKSDGIVVRNIEVEKNS